MITCQTAVVGGQQQKSPHVTLVTHASAVIVYALSRFCERVRVRVCVRVRACVCVPPHSIPCFSCCEKFIGKLQSMAVC